MLYQISSWNAEEIHDHIKTAAQLLNIFVFIYFIV